MPPRPPRWLDGATGKIPPYHGHMGFAGYPFVVSQSALPFGVPAPGASFLPSEWMSAGMGGAGLEGREGRRRRLNGLVDASVARDERQRCNVAFVKTHKTASTTLTAALYRYGLRHGRRVARFDVGGTAVTLQHAAEQVRSCRSVRLGVVSWSWLVGLLID